MSIEDFKKNKPKYSFDNIKISYTEGFQCLHDVKLCEIFNDTCVKIDLRSIWGICVNQTPYCVMYVNNQSNEIPVDNNYIEESQVTFYKVIEKGRICYVAPFIYSYTKNYGLFSVSHLSLKEENTNANQYGNISDFEMYGISLEVDSIFYLNKQNLLKNIDDNELEKTIINDRQAKKKLFYYLKKYNERNPYYIQP